MKRTRPKKTDAKRDRESVENKKADPCAGELDGPDNRAITDHDTTRAEQTETPPTKAGKETDPAQTAPTIEQLQARVASLEDGLLRAKADCQNLQRRTTIERSEAIRYANTELIKSLLPVLDDFERALAATQDGDNLTAVVDGVRLVHENLIKALCDHGLSSIEALHQPFDPTVHEAMMQQPSADHPDQTVIEEVAKGYRLLDRVIRPVKVVVSKAVEQTKAGQETAGETERQAKA